jgi:hypothetical protein
MKNKNLIAKLISTEKSNNKFQVNIDENIIEIIESKDIKYKEVDKTCLSKY